jgi:hypothetical protein
VGEMGVMQIGLSRILGFGKKILKLGIGFAQKRLS